MFTSTLLFLMSNIAVLVLHIANISSFPKPLSTAMEHTYLEQYKMKNDLNARNKLIEHNLRLVAHVMKKYYSAGHDMDDLISIGTIGLIKGIDTFNYTKGTRLATYAARCIENEVLMYFRSQKKTAQDISINEPIEVDKDGNALTLIDIVAEEGDVADDIDLKIKIEKMYGYIEKALSPRERTVLRRRYGLNGQKAMTQREVADDLKISRSYVSRIEKAAVEKLGEEFEKQMGQ